MAKKMSIMNLVSTKLGALTALLVLIFGVIFFKSCYELVDMFLKDIIMSFGITIDYQVLIAVAIIAFVVVYLITKGKVKWSWK
jgi:hypothetical protein